MIAIRHTGIYVNDMKRMEAFYTSVFQMHAICSMEPDEGELFDELLGTRNARIMTSKLITPYGKTAGQGDMVELVKVLSEGDCGALPEERPISMIGMTHLAFQVEDITASVDRIMKNGGLRKTGIKEMRNGNKCCFCTDPEGNWIELIERRN